MKQRKAGPPVHRLRGNAQPLKVSHDIGLHTLQTGPCLRNPLGGYAKGDGTAWSFMRKPETPSLRVRLTQHSP